MEECAAEGVLGGGVGAFEGEVVACFFDEGRFGCEVEGGVGEGDGDGFATGFDVGETEGDLGVGVEELVAVRVVDEV